MQIYFISLFFCLKLIGIPLFIEPKFKFREDLVMKKLNLGCGHTGDQTGGDDGGGDGGNE
jgi:hypothetical protein